MIAGPAARAAVTQALRRHGRASALVRLSAVDAAGNRRTQTVPLRIIG